VQKAAFQISRLERGLGTVTCQILRGKYGSGEDGVARLISQHNSPYRLLASFWKIEGDKMQSAK